MGCGQSWKSGVQPGSEATPRFIRKEYLDPLRMAAKGQGKVWGHEANPASKCVTAVHRAGHPGTCCAFRDLWVSRFS